MDHERFEARSRTDAQPARATERLALLRRRGVNLRMLGLRRRAAEILREIFAAEKQEWRAAIFSVSRALANRWLDPEETASAPLALLLAVDEDSFEVIVARLRRERAEARER
jgi:hypothetical protein